MEKNRIRHRNKLLRQINAWKDRFGSYARVDETPALVNTKTRYFHRFIRGNCRGKLLLIYPLLTNDERCIPIENAYEMQRFELTKQIVCCALNVGDLFTILAQDEGEYPRNLRTYRYRERIITFERWSDHGESEGQEF